MLLLLLLISSGCDVNIPGCGKRSLPFFKKITPPPAASPVAQAPAVSNPPAAAAPAPAVPLPAKPAPKTAPPLSMEMSLSKPQPSVPSTPTATATPLEVEKIAYTTLEKGKPTLWLMNPNGTDNTRLTAIGTGSWFPLWSPNGKLLAFLSNMNDGKVNLYLYQKGGKDFRQLTFFPDYSIPVPGGLKPPLTWSPKSDEIAFIYHRQVWKVTLDSTLQATLASVNPAYSITGIDWAPHRDNRYVAFLVKQGDGFCTLNLVNPRLLDRLQLVQSTFDGPLVDFSWTADARKIAYLAGKHSIYLASSETSAPKALLLNSSLEFGPLVSYSPSESASNLMLLVKESPDSDYRLALLDKASKSDQEAGTVKFLTNPGVVNAVWSPDGSKIAYVTSNGDLWVMDALTGANKARVSISVIQSPSWSKK